MKIDGLEDIDAEAGCARDDLHKLIFEKVLHLPGTKRSQFRFQVKFKKNLNCLTQILSQCKHYQEMKSSH